MNVGLHKPLNYKIRYIAPYLCKNHLNDPLEWFCHAGLLMWTEMWAYACRGKAAAPGQRLHRVSVSQNRSKRELNRTTIE
jgi:hypothetical protein